MTPEQVFAIANAAALLSWVGLVLFQRKRWATDGVVLTAVSLIATAYVVIIASRWAGSEGGFSSLKAVAQLFSDPWLLLAGWLHYLAFDLLVGRWEARDAAERGIPRWLVAPFLGLTFMFGPAGWASYCVLRTVWAGRRVR